MSIRVIFVIISLLISVNSFGQSYDIILDSNDIRIENASYSGVSGYNVYIRKKPDIESVMLTEPSGAHSLRATAWNSLNGNEQRQISGVTLTGDYSRNSIVSSTPQPRQVFLRYFLSCIRI